ncbi:MAG: MOSC domain-containing protein [Pseudomonadota bacterium]|nr:MOSC domain-containing protein [Pseudomonadota bacterium]
MKLPQAIGQVRAVLTGRAVPYTRPGSFSAIAKQPVSGPVAVLAESLEGDEQGDRRVHGGPDKAVHVYTWAHYATWRAELGALPVLAAPGAFGENLSVDDLDEQNVCMGDEWQIGSALFAVSQGRQPCWKLNDRFGVPDMARRVQDTGLTGWYLRVLRQGTLRADDAVTLVARPHPDWPLDRVAALIRQRVCAPAVLREVLALPLPPSWRRLFERRLAQGQAESWAQRLWGDRPAPGA